MKNSEIIENKANQTVGFAGQGMTKASATPPPSTFHVIEKGRVIEGADSTVEILRFKKGDEDKIEQAMELVKSLGDEPPVSLPDQYKIADPAEYDYDAQAQLDVLGGI